MFRSILSATDFSLGAAHAVEMAARWAEAEHARLDVVHVITPILGVVPETSFLAELRSSLRDDAEGKLEALVAALRPRARVHAHLLEGAAVPQQILAEAARLESDLVVVGTAGANATTRALLGSIADRVVRRSDVPVLVVPRDAPTTLPRAIVVPTDFSEPSRRAVALAREIATPFAARVEIVHGYEIPFFADRGSAAVRELPETLRQRVRTFHALDAAARVHELECDPATAVLRVVASSEANAIVMAGGGRSVASSWLLGSVTDRVLRASPVSVLVLRDAPPR
jgi:nucleotide-binding universal stress UspA family protein